MVRVSLTPLLILIALAVLSASPSYSSTPEGSLPERLMMTSHDPKEQHLLADLKEARRSSGATSAAAFDKLFALAQYDAETTSTARIIEIGSEMRDCYSHLQPDEQEKLAPLLLQAAQKNLNYQRKEAAEVFYAPVILTTSDMSHWKNADIMISQLNSVANKLCEKKQLLTAERVFQVALSIRPDDENNIRNLARLHFELMMYDKAKPEYEKLTAKPVPDVYDLRELAETYRAAGEIERLRTLMPTVIHLCSQANSAGEKPSDAQFNAISEVICAFVGAKLYPESRILDQALIAAMAADYSSALPVNRIAQAFDSSHYQDACELYQSWTDDLKHRRGVDSKEWVSGLQWKLTFYNVCNAKVPPAERDVLRNQIDEVWHELREAKPKPGSAEQRLNLLSCYRTISNGLPQWDNSCAAAIFENVPDEELSVRLYCQGAEFYAGLKPSVAAQQQCKEQAIARICGLLKPENSFLLPYFNELKRPSSTSVYGFSKFVDNLTSALERPNAYTVAPVLLKDELFKEGHFKDAKRLGEEIQSRKTHAP